MSIDWIYRDPLRGVSIDKFPYNRDDGEIRLDFIFKGCLYSSSIVLCMLAGAPELLALFGVWLGVNFLRRKG